MWCVRQGPIDMLEPLFKILLAPFNLLIFFKDIAHRIKNDNFLVSDPDFKKASTGRT